MELTQADYERIAHCFPKHRGTVTYGNLQVLNAILYIAENGAKWRRLPEIYGHWHTVYTRMRGWARSGVLARVFETLQQEQIIRIRVESASLDSTSIKVHPDGTGALKKTGRSPSGALAEDSQPRFIWLLAMSGRPSASPSHRARTGTPREGANSLEPGRTAPEA
jgi:transposase